MNTASVYVLAALLLFLVIFVCLRLRWRTFRKMYQCFHHDIRGGNSYVIVDGFTDQHRKMWHCSSCGKVWIL